MARTEKDSSAWPLVVLLVVAAAALWMMQMRRTRPPSPLVGLRMPPLEAAGWINTDRPPAAGDLRGRVVLIDFWATWCNPCVESMPHLVEIYRRFNNQGLVVVGFTDEDDRPANTVSGYVKTVDGLEWPIGYGAFLPFEVMGIQYLPTYVLFDRSGRSVWAGNDLGGLDDAIVMELAKGDAPPRQPESQSPGEREGS
jgi:thiol-disulfide isomerase/thioredoxin